MANSQDFWNDLAADFDLTTPSTSLDHLGSFPQAPQYRQAPFAANCNPPLLATTAPEVAGYTQGICPPDYFSPQIIHEPRIETGLDCLFLDDAQLPWPAPAPPCNYPASMDLYRRHTHTTLQAGSVIKDVPTPESLASSNVQYGVSGDETGQQTDSSVADAWVPEDVYSMGYQDENGEWKCKHEGCLSKKVFSRACDLRKHYRSHQKMFFCSEADCPWLRIGFSSRKDCRRHKASHEPSIKCPVEDCDRVFSRVDNMKEHHKKIHQRSRNNLFPRPCRRRSTATTRRADLLRRAQ